MTQNRIKVVDSRPGSGKTSYAIQYINSLPEDTKIIYITPFLKECDRMKDSCPTRNFYAPDSRLGKGSKMVNMIELIKKGRNVVSTHALFSNIDDRLIDAIRSHSYILILDEVMNVVEKFDLYKDDPKKTTNQKELLTKEDIAILLQKKIIEVNEETYMVTWTDREHTLNKYVQLKTLADREMLYLIHGDLLIWSFPIEVFREGVFDEIFILTYLFDNQIQAYYYKFFDLEYTTYIVKETAKKKYDLFLAEDYQETDIEWRRTIKNLIHICDNEKLNKIGSAYRDASNRLVESALSKSWYERADKESIKVLVNNCVNFFVNYTKGKGVQKMWTCFKANKKLFKNNFIPVKGWIELNARATNDYGDRNSLVYPINRYLNPFYIFFFEKKNIFLDQDGYALSELIQWIFRSAIRNDKEIWLYIPSQRMRTLLTDWLNV